LRTITIMMIPYNNGIWYPPSTVVLVWWSTP
jgi:hypothetical protein